MGHRTYNQPKCKMVLHGKTLLEWQLAALRGAGIEEIALVRGYLPDAFDDEQLTYFENERWSTTNMVVSLMAADEWLKSGDCVVTYSDIVYSHDSVCRLLRKTDDIAIAYDPGWRQLWELRFVNPLDDAESFKLTGGYVTEIGNSVDSIDEIQGQYMGLFRITEAGWALVSRHLDALPAERRDIMDMTTLLQRLVAERVNIAAVPISDSWYEVDSEADLSLYQKLASLF